MFYDNFVRLCNSIGKTSSAVVTEIGFSRASASGWKNGKTPTDATVLRLADYFGVTVDYLLTGDQKEKPALEDKDGLTARDRRDIARDLERIMSDIESSETLMFDGDPATEGARETLRNAIAMGLEYAKKVNKETYTPKKYRKSKE